MAIESNSQTIATNAPLHVPQSKTTPKYTRSDLDILLVSADSKDSGTASSEDGDRSAHHRLELVEREHGGTAADTGSEWSESRPDSDPESPECLYSEPRPPPHLLHPAYHQHPHSHPLHHANSRFHSTSSSPPPTPSLHQTDASSPIAKPRIWSLADMATKENDVRTSISSSSVYSTGKMVPSLAGRAAAAAAAAALPHPANYAAARHHEFYRSLYGPHLAGATTSELLESYSRTLGASLSSANGNGAATPPFTSVAAVMAAAAAAATSSSSAAPFDLAVSASGGASSTTSSSVSSPTEAPPSLNLSNSTTLKSESRAS